MASAVEEEGKQYASTDREESSEEQGEPTAVHNVSTAIQKYALKVMDMLSWRYEELRRRIKYYRCLSVRLWNMLELRVKD